MIMPCTFLEVLTGQPLLPRHRPQPRVSPYDQRSRQEYQEGPVASPEAQGQDRNTRKVMHLKLRHLL